MTTRMTIMEPGSVAGPPIPFVDSADAPTLSLYGETYPVTWAAYPNGAAFWAVYDPQGDVVLSMMPCTLPQHDSLREVHADLARAMVVLSKHVVEKDARYVTVEEPPHHGQILQYGRHVGQPPRPPSCQATAPTPSSQGGKLSPVSARHRRRGRA